MSRVLAKFGRNALTPDWSSRQQNLSYPKIRALCTSLLEWLHPDPNCALSMRVVTCWRFEQTTCIVIT